MKNKEQPIFDRWDPEPRWPAFIAILAVGGLYAALPGYLIVGPHWLFPAIVLALLVPTIISHGTVHHRINRFFGFTVSIVLTIGNVCFGWLMIRACRHTKKTHGPLAFGFGSLVYQYPGLAFVVLAAGCRRASWATTIRPSWKELPFPQMTMTDEARSTADEHGWSPNFADYLFLAFNTSTAFSPTDAPVLASMGETLDDAAITHLTNRPRVVGGAGYQYPSEQRLPDSTTCRLPCSLSSG